MKRKQREKAKRIIVMMILIATVVSIITPLLYFLAGLY